MGTLRQVTYASFENPTGLSFLASHGYPRFGSLLVLFRVGDSALDSVTRFSTQKIP